MKEKSSQKAVLQIVPRKYKVEVFSKEEEDFAKCLEPVLSAGNFDWRYPIFGPEPKCRRFNMSCDVPHEFRLCGTFLHLLGRQEKMADAVAAASNYELKPITGYQPVIRRICLDPPLMEQDPNKTITLDAQAVQEYAKSKDKYGALLTKSVIDDGERAKFGGPMHGINVESLTEMYGENKFEIDVKEVQQLARSCRIRLGKNLPRRFYIELCKIIASQKDEAGIHGDGKVPDTPLAYYQLRKTTALKNLMANEPTTELGLLLNKVTSSPMEYNFLSTEHWQSQTSHRSITELASEVAVSCEGYFLVDRHGRIATKPARSLNFVVACGPDFTLPVESARYFHAQTGEFLPGQEQALRSRIIDTYDLIFTSFKAMKVTHPSLLPMGLGQFLPPHPTSKKLVYHIYHEAQFHLLSTKDYRFEAVYLALGHPIARRAAIEALESDFPLRCPLICHRQDAKGMAMALAGAGFASSLLVPGDPIFLMQGCAGRCWELGYGDEYAGEQDTLNNTTIILMDNAISAVFEDKNRVISQRMEIRVMEGSNGTILGEEPDLALLDDPEDYIKRHQLCTIFNALAADVILYQPYPEELADHVVKWGIDLMLARWQGANLLGNGSADGALTMKKTISKEYQARFLEWLLSLSSKYQRELELNVLESGIAWALNQGGRKTKKTTENKSKHMLKVVEIINKYRSQIYQYQKGSYLGHGGRPPTAWDPGAGCPIQWVLSQLRYYKWVQNDRCPILNEIFATGFKRDTVPAAPLFQWETRNYGIDTSSFVEDVDDHVQWAIRTGHYALAMRLIDKGVELNTLLSGKETYLHVALRRRARDIALRLIWLKCSLGFDDHDMSPLHVAIASKMYRTIGPMLDLVKERIGSKEYDGFLDKVTKYGYAPLHMALQNNSLDLALRLLRRGADVQKEDLNGDTALHYTLRLNNSTLAKTLIEQYDADWSICNNAGLDCLHLALKYSCKPICDLIWDKDTNPTGAGKIAARAGTDPDFQPPLGNSYLHFATYYENPQMAMKLLKAGYKANQENKYGYTPQNFLSEFDALRLKLLAGDSDIGMPDIVFDHVTDLHMHAITGDLDKCKELVSKQPKLMVGDAKLNKEAVRGLVKSALDKAAITPLICALKYQHTSIVRYLLIQEERLAKEMWNLENDAAEQKEIAWKSKRLSELQEAMRQKLIVHSSSNKRKIEAQQRLLKHAQRSHAELLRTQKLRRIQAPYRALTSKQPSATRLDLGINLFITDKIDSDVFRKTLLPPDYRPHETIEVFFGRMAESLHQRNFSERSTKLMVQQAKLFATLKLIAHANEEEANEGQMQAGKEKDQAELTMDMIMAIYIYTYLSPIPEILNEAITDCIRNLKVSNGVAANAKESLALSTWRPFLYYFMTGLDELRQDNRSAGTVYKAVNVALESDIYSIGKTFRWGGFSNATKDIGVAQKLLGDFDQSQILMIINSQNCIDVSRYSYYPEEKEVVFMPDCQFEVGNWIGEEMAKVLMLPASVVEINTCS